MHWFHGLEDRHSICNGRPNAEIVVRKPCKYGYEKTKNEIWICLPQTINVFHLT